MRILVDMNLSPQWIHFLKGAGFEAIHWSSVGVPSAPDAEIMTFADEHGCVVLTHDLDFGAMLVRSGAASPSVLQLRSNDLDPDLIGGTVLSALVELRDHPDEHLIVTVDPRRTRLRILPFKR